MLIREPSKRMSLVDISKHAWLQIPTSNEDLTTIEGSDLDPTPLVTKDNITPEDHSHIVSYMVEKKIAPKDQILQ